MIVRVDKREKDTIEKICWLSECKVTFYTMEANPSMLQVEITEMNGEELAREDLWNVARSIVWALNAPDIIKPKI